MLRAHGVSDKGSVRAVNEDCLAIDYSHGLCVVADGMGGHNAGEVAARIAVDAVVEFMTDDSVPLHVEWPFGFDPALSEIGNRLRTAIHLANLQVLERAVSSDAYAGMGTTIVAAVIAGNRLSVGHVGDSRLYIVADDRIRQVTSDDSWTAKVLAQDPSTDVVVLRNHPMRNVLTNVVGSRHRTDVHITEMTLCGSELVVLTTDGVHGALEDEQIEQLVLDATDLRLAAEAVVAAALERGSRDNCTALVARYVADLAEA